MILQSFMAGKGDAFLLSWHNDTDHHMLIDAGTPGTYRFITKALATIASIDAIVVTHVDYDHIGGFQKLLKDEAAMAKIKQIFINTPELALSPEPGDKVGISHGVDFEKQLISRGLSASALVAGNDATNIINIHGLELLILSPPKEILDEFHSLWTADNLYQQYLQERQNDGKVARPQKDKPAYQEVLDNPEKIKDWRHDLTNASSIAFLASFKGESILFLGDANPDVVVTELKRLGFSETNKMRAGLCKLAHHGSRNNTTADLLKLIDCDKYYISTDGTPANYHPDRETIVLLAEYSRPDASKKITLYTNYELDFSEIISEEELVEWNIAIEHKQIIP